MLFQQKHSLTDLILTQLVHGSCLSLDLIDQIKKQRPGTTKQGVYAALRSLKDAETVLMAKGTVTLNLAWIEKMRRFAAIAQHNSVHNTSGSGNIIDLKEGEKIQYVFRDLNSTDALWVHHIYILLEAINTNEPFYNYFPHWWFYFARQESEEKFIQFVCEHQHPAWFLIGSQTELDRIASRSLQNKSLQKIQYHLVERRPFPKNYYYLNIVGDFIIEASIDQAVADEMDALYQRSSRPDEITIAQLRELASQPGRTKYTISRNARKAARLKKKFGKGFIV